MFSLTVEFANSETDQNLNLVLRVSDRCRSMVQTGARTLSGSGEVVCSSHCSGACLAVRLRSTNILSGEGLTK